MFYSFCSIFYLSCLRFTLRLQLPACLNFFCDFTCFFHSIIPSFHHSAHNLCTLKSLCSHELSTSLSHLILWNCAQFDSTLCCMLHAMHIAHSHTHIYMHHHATMHIDFNKLHGWKIKSLNFERAKKTLRRFRVELDKIQFNKIQK